MRLWKPHDPGRSRLHFTIRHHVTNETDSQNAGALTLAVGPGLRKLVDEQGELADAPGRCAGPGRRGRARRVPYTIDVDSTICEVYGLRKQGAAFGHT
jgi:hypothetical protein